MRLSMPLALLVLCAATPAFADERAAPVTPKLTNAQRTDVAVDFITKLLTGNGTTKSWIPSNQKLAVRPAIIAPAGNPRNPMTGDGPIVV